MKIIALPHYHNAIFKKENTPPIKTKNDTFIKTNTSNFQPSKTTLSSKYEPFREEMTNYILNCEKIHLSKIQKIINKYSPKTKVQNLDRYSQKDEINDRMCAITVRDFDIEFENEKTTPKENSQEIYIKPPKLSKGKEERVILLERLLHETIHIFQEESQYRTSYSNFLTSYIQNSKNQQTAINTLPHAIEAFSDIEETLLDIISYSCSADSNIPKPLPKNTTLDNIFKNTLDTDFETTAATLIETIEKSLQSKIGDIDSDLIKEFIILCAQNEKEAYELSYQNTKKLLNIKGKTETDLRVEMYDRLIKSIKASILEKDNSFEKKFNLFKGDIQNCVSSKEKIDLKDIQKILSFYSPKTKVKRKSIFSFNQTGAINAPIEFERTQDKITTKPLDKKMYVNLSKSKTALLSNIIHEAAHIFQEEADNRTSLDEFYLNALQKNPDDFITISVCSEVYEKIEAEMFALLRQFVAKPVLKGKQSQKTRINLEKVFEKNGINIDNALKNLINKTITDYKQKLPEIDEYLLLDYIEHKIRNELEAYGAEKEFYLENSITENLLEVDPILKMYKKMQEATEYFKNQND